MRRWLGLAAVGLLFAPGWALAQEAGDFQDFEEMDEEMEFDSEEDLFADTFPIFVSEFQSSSPEFMGLAAMMRDFLEERVDAHPLFRTISVHEAPDFGEHTALLYLQTCPIGEQVGCAYIVAQKVEAAYALVGVVHEIDGERSVELSVVDVTDGREAFSLQVGLDLGGDDRLAEGVVRLLVSIAEGRAGQLEDIRQDEKSTDERAPIDNEEVARQLRELADELGGETTIDHRGNRRVNRPEYTLEDLGEEQATDSAKQWELLGITADEYLKWRNSGMTLHAWKQARLGRRGQVLIRPVVGPAKGPFNTTYYGIWAIEESPPNDVLETYAWQGFQPGTGLSGGGWVGFGLSPTLEVDVGGGVNRAKYTLYGREQTGAEPPEQGRDPDKDGQPGVTVQQLNSWAGVRLFSILRFTESIRPLLGAGVVWRRGNSYLDIWPEPVRSSGGKTPLPEFAAPTLLEAQFIPGLELALGPVADLCFSLPIGFGVAGQALEITDGDSELITEKQDPEDLGLLSVGLEVGLVLHLFGPKVEVDDLYMDTMDEPLD